jgi:hypothetical protein
MRLDEPVGTLPRPTPDEGRKRDRRAGLIYGSRSRRARAQARKPWSGAQGWALQHELCLGEVIDDDLDIDLPLLERPGLIRLAQLTLPGLWLPGPVLVEASASLDDLGGAVLAEYLAQAGRELYVGPYGKPLVKPVTARTRHNWAASVGATRVQETAEQLAKTAKDAMVRSGSLDPLLKFGSGPRRDVDLARQVAIERLAAGWSKRRIRDYLEMYGFRNSSGTVGRWSHHQLARLVGEPP